MNKIMRGSCLCGGVRIEVQGGLELQPQACHCSQCRKQTGHFLAAVNVRRDALKVQGEDKVAWYQSSDRVRRGFCSVCGSTLFWNAEIEGCDYIAIAMGLLDEPTGTRFSKHTFVNDKGDYYEIDDDVPQSESF
jgi:hypothetical protein